MIHDVLVLPAKPDPERDAVAAAWQAAGGDTLRLDRFWEQPGVARERVAIYGPDTFALVVAQVLGVTLVSPPDDLLVQAGAGLTRRRVARMSLAEVLHGPFPVFAKPLVPKTFRAAVWPGPEALRAECEGLALDAAVIVSEVVAVRAEARAWVCDGEVLSCAVYEGEGSAADAARFLAGCASKLDLPGACVLDGAYIEGRGWSLLEANAAWGAGLNGCAPDAACACIDRATRTR